jgi:hypothetical protein
MNKRKKRQEYEHRVARYTFTPATLVPVFAALRRRMPLSFNVQCTEHPSTDRLNYLINALVQGINP